VLFSASSLLSFVLFSFTLGCGKKPEPTTDTAGSGASSSATAQGERDSSQEDLSDRSPSDRLPPLTADQKQRLGPALRRVMAGDTLSKSGSEPGRLRKTEPVGEREGKQVYSVLIEGADARALQDANIPVVSAAGGIITARLTTGQIHRVASIQNVRKIRFPGQSTPQ
jgi:hypothetical protein